MSAQNFLTRTILSLWYTRVSALTPIQWVFFVLLLPMTLLFYGVVFMRRLYYRYVAPSPARLSVPVIVVGNLIAGGSGKTPLVLWLIEALRALGWAPGVISRGYGRTRTGIIALSEASSAADVGDEPRLIFQRARCPVWVGEDRRRVGEALLAANPECTILISDDGLQHYGLPRDIEIVVFDARGAGNTFCLPAGPLREPLRRLESVDAIIWNLPAGGVPPLNIAVSPPQFRMTLAPAAFYALNEPLRRATALHFEGQRLYAIAGMGYPERFFNTLRTLGLTFEAIAFPDHYAYTERDLAFSNDGVLLMTEKDAVKCRGLMLHTEAWVLPVDAVLENAENGSSFIDYLLKKHYGSSTP